MVIQSSSHNCPIDINEPVLRFSNKKACCAFCDNLSDNGIFASDCGAIVFLFATVTGCPYFQHMFVHTCSAPSCKQ